jgi:protein-disulfide isomerase
MAETMRRLNRLLWAIPIFFLPWAVAGCGNDQTTDKAAATPPGVRLVPSPAAGSGPEELYMGGEPGAMVRIEVFSDFQCPLCKEFYLGTLKPIIADYAGTQKVSVVYHDLPLEMHQFARPAARLALAAARLGREEWLRVTDEIYKDQEQWSVTGNFEPALSKALNPTQLMRVVRMAGDPAIDAAVQQEVLLAESRRVTSTPTFFISTKSGREQRINGAIAYPVLKDFLDRLLGGRTDAK